jgi:D-sedoheptulose 7-phosphate isomerase
MRLNMKDYINELNNILLNIQVTYPDNTNIDLNDSIEIAVRTITKQSQQGNKVIIIGNGGSASIANHLAIDLWKNSGIRATTYSDSALLTCISNDFGYDYVFEKPIEMFADKGDVLIAISSSGMSKNIINGAVAAKKKGCKIITMSGFKENNTLRSKGEINFYVASDSYGYVELAHSVLSHCIVDIITNEK